MVERCYTGAVFRAAIHLWVAASSDERLRERVQVLEAKVGRETHRLALELLGVDESVPGVREAVQATLDLARGLGLANLLSRRQPAPRAGARAVGRHAGRGRGRGRESGDLTSGS